MSDPHFEDGARQLGDFYTEDDDDVCRSAVYAEDDGDVYRSAVSMNWWEVESGDGKPLDFPCPLLSETNTKCGNLRPDVQHIQTVYKFSKGRDAPDLPTDVFFVLAESTIEVCHWMAHDLGNQLIDIFNSEDTMHIIKTSPTKFAIKAESTHPAWFVLKARIYSKTSSHIVEFQRYNGDVVAFSQFFHKVMVLLNDKHNPPIEKCDVMLPHIIQEEASLQPFIDIANNTRDPLLLAEAASELANVKKQKLLELCVPDAFAAFKTILRVGGYSALCPLAQLLSRLAVEEKASPFFADTDFWTVLLDVVVAERTCGELRTQYALVASSALALGASNEQMCVLKAAIIVKGINEQGRQMLEGVAQKTEKGCFSGRTWPRLNVIGQKDSR